MKKYVAALFSQLALAEKEGGTAISWPRESL